MLICRVVGTAVSTIKHEKLKNLKLLIVQEVTPENEITGSPFVAIDTVGAGEKEVILVVKDNPATMAVSHQQIPTDAAIVGIVDCFSVKGKFTFKKD